MFVCSCVSMKAEILCHLKDFRINNFAPEDEDMLGLTALACFPLENNQRLAGTLNQSQQQGTMLVNIS